VSPFIAIFCRDDRLRTARSRGDRRSRNHPPRGNLAYRLRRIQNISFIHEIADSGVDDITAEILAEAALLESPETGADLQAARFDHARDLRKHETA
jgi:hypothetical protein